MKHEPFDHAPIVEDWLKEPIWLPEGDTARIAQLVHQTPQQRGWLRPFLNRRTHDMFSATKIVTAGVILAAVGGYLLLGGGLLPQDHQALPAASATAAATATASAAPDASVAPVASGDPEVTVPETAAGALVMGEPATDVTAAGWAESGSAPYFNADGTGFGQLDHLQVIGDRLVALGSTLDAEEGPSHEVVMTSTDGRTWVPVTLPGDEPVLNDLVATADGLVAGGQDRVDGAKSAALWSSVDGLEWATMPAPEGAGVISQIVSASDPLVVRANQRLYELGTDGAWIDRNRMPNSQILRGPSGYIVWQGGGQDQRFGLTMFQQATLDSPISEIGLPGKLGRGALSQISVQLFVVGDQWVMVPEGYETPIYVSNDGFEWREVPRPDRMLGDYVEWVGLIGDQLQAFGIQYRNNGSPSGVWTIDLTSSDPAPFEMVDRAGDQHMGAPVTFGDGHLATGINTGRGDGITTWEHAGTE